jgi:hypothetical protein
MRRRFKGASVGATETGGQVAATEAGEGPERWTSGRKGRGPEALARRGAGLGSEGSPIGRGTYAPIRTPYGILARHNGRWRGQAGSCRREQ